MGIRKNGTLCKWRRPTCSALTLETHLSMSDDSRHKEQSRVELQRGPHGAYLYSTVFFENDTFSLLEQLSTVFLTFILSNFLSSANDKGQ